MFEQDSQGMEENGEQHDALLYSDVTEQVEEVVYRLPVTSSVRYLLLKLPLEQKEEWMVMKG